MGSAALLDSAAAATAVGNAPSAASTDDDSSKSSPGMARKQGKEKAAVGNPKKASTANKKDRKRSSPQDGEEAAGSRKMPKRAAACTDFKEKSVLIDDKSSLIETKKAKLADEEILAIGLTAGREEGRPNRRLTEFILYNEEGVPQPLEMLEVDDLFISGLILPLEVSAEKEKDKENAVRCEGFGRIESWSISGYEEGSPVIWLSTDIADYDCLKPAASYKKYYDHFLEKARACMEVYKKLSKSSGGDPDCGLDELLAGVIRAMSGSKSFSNGSSVKDFLISQGDFIYNQLIGLDETSKSDRMFIELPALAALRDECNKHGNFAQAESASSGKGIVIGSKSIDGEAAAQYGSSAGGAEEDDDVKLAKLLQEEEYWQSRKQKKNQGSASGSSKFYIKINEDEIANDYPLPAYYKNDEQETDEFIVFDSELDMVDIDDLPRSMLHNWSLYDSDSRLISLELLPMKSCDDIDVTIFGSGTMTADDGSGFCLETDTNQSSPVGSGAQHVDGMPIYLSAIKEWMIEFGSSMVFISIRTDMAWYRLGKPSKQYASWYTPVLKTARVGISIITMLKEQSRVSKLSFADVIKKVSEFDNSHLAYISSNPAAVERYVVVHGQIILQLFAVYPDEKIKKCSFVVGLSKKMEERHHTKWLVKKKKILLKNLPNLNPRGAMGPVLPKRKAMKATTTRLITRIWGEYYSNYSPEEIKEGTGTDAKEEDDIEEQEENEEDENEDISVNPEESPKTGSAPRRSKPSSTHKEVRWHGESMGQTSSGEALYRQAVVHGETIAVGDAVALEIEDLDELPMLYYVEYMFETSRGSKMCHGRMMKRGTQTILGNAANEREVFLVNECSNIALADIKQTVVVHIRSRPWGYQYRKSDADADMIERTKAEERKKKGLPLEYYCKSLYWPERGAFFSLSRDTMGLGSGVCHSCKVREVENEKGTFKLNSSKNGFIYDGVDYLVHDYVYISPHFFTEERVETGTFKSGRNVGLKAYVVCQLLEIICPKESKKNEANSTQMKVRRFYRPEDISTEKAYCSDIQEVYYSEEMQILNIESIEGKCEVKKRSDIPSCDSPMMFQHVFYCEHLYDPSKGSLKQLPSHIKLKYSVGLDTDAASRKRKGKSKEGETDLESEKQRETSQGNNLATLDIFAGCGGLSEGLQRSGISTTKWAIEYEEPAADAFKLNHPESLMFVNNCNVILRAIMQKCGDIDDCISTPEAAELAASLDEKEKSNLPLPGQVDFINGGPPCQGFSGMNRFNQSTWSKVQCEMILAFLSFADYFRPRYFLLENVRNFVSFNKGQTFRLTLASLLEMGYQVRFGILEAGAYGVSQSRKRAFIWAASPEDVLPEWPEPMHVFAAPELKITLSENLQYAAVRSTANGAPFRAMTVRDTIGDLPAVINGASQINMEYQNDPVSWFQKKIRGNMAVLTDHISKEMNELNLIRCQKIPKRPGADWRDLPEEKVKLSNGQVVDLIPWCLPNTANRHNQWKGLFGRLDWEGNFPTSITDPQPMGKVGMCFHPDQDRILTVRECARSQGFRDSYLFAGHIQHRHRQIGNAVPPPLAYALGRKLKEAMDSKRV